MGCDRSFRRSGWNCRAFRLRWGETSRIAGGAEREKERQKEEREKREKREKEEEDFVLTIMEDGYGRKRSD
ncbi:hypothetical protein KM043_010615 [Ampulex compressa]|nr:hypothetical protein KM043_010615 [Ampulex compressa]